MEQNGKITQGLNHGLIPEGAELDRGHVNVWSRDNFGHVTNFIW